MSYRLTAAGQELGPIVESIGRWGVRWVPELGDEDLDPHLLMWDMRRTADHATFPSGRTVVQFTFSDVRGKGRNWWLVVDAEGADVCDVDPGHPVTVTVETDLRTLTCIWRGDRGWDDALRAEELHVDGPQAMRRGLPRWLRLSAFAPVPRPVTRR